MNNNLLPENVNIDSIVTLINDRKHDLKKGLTNPEEDITFLKEQLNKMFYPVDGKLIALVNDYAYDFFFSREEDAEVVPAGQGEMYDIKSGDDWITVAHYIPSDSEVFYGNIGPYRFNINEAGQFTLNGKTYEQIVAEQQYANSEDQHTR